VDRDADLVRAILTMTPEFITATIEKYRGELDGARIRLRRLAPSVQRSERQLVGRAGQAVMAKLLERVDVSALTDE